MPLKLLTRLWDRIEIARGDSDAVLFHDLIYGGEMVLKLIVAGLVAAVDEERDRHQYRLIHRLVRAVGLKEWSIVADQVLLGPPAQYLQPAAYEEQRQLTQKGGPGSWQHEAVTLLHQCLEALNPGRERPPDRLEGRRWLDLFSQVRNKTAHGAPTPGQCGALCGPLEQSLRLMCDHFALFARPWAHLHRNLSGKYRITRLSDGAEIFDQYRAGNANLADGVHIQFDRPTRVELLGAVADATDFFLPNGNFTDRHFEMLSYLTNQRMAAASGPYMQPAQALPPSDTEPLGALEVQGNCFGNLPPARPGYIPRRALEDDLFKRLMDDNHPIITLVGRGGIGKTSLALHVLHRISREKRFDVLLWFSARDIDLLAEGPKPVRPHVLSERDIADEFVRLLNLPTDKATKSTEQFASALTRSSFGPMLVVFDNFETVRNPLELFTWLDTYHRLPSKILITTRFRDFKGDYPVEVPGMTEEECNDLVTAHGRQLGVLDLLTDRFREHLYEESAGHPYIVKVLLGEVARTGKVDRVERIIAGQDDILTALFERTYANLTPSARRVFLTLCAWRTLVPQLALEAVLLRPANERMAVADAVDELERSSLVEQQVGGPDADVFLSVPLSAVFFGKRKLQVSPYRAAVEADLSLLRAFGTGRKSELDQGVGPRIAGLFRAVATQVSRGDAVLEEQLPLLQYVAGHHPPAWLLLADLYEGLDADHGKERAADAVRRYLEERMGEEVEPAAWQRLADLCRRLGDRSGEMYALIEMCRLPATPLATASATARRLAALVDAGDSAWEADEKRVWMQKLAEAMDARMERAEAGDCAALARLRWHLGDRSAAEHWTREGLNRDGRDAACQKMKSVLGL